MKRSTLALMVLGASFVSASGDEMLYEPKESFQSFGTDYGFGTPIRKIQKEALAPKEESPLPLAPESSSENRDANRSGLDIQLSCGSKCGIPTNALKGRS